MHQGTSGTTSTPSRAALGRRAMLRLGASVLLAFGFWASTASARSEAVSHYTLKQTYSGALRYLRVDLGFEILEKDPDAAYLLFKYRPAPDKPETHGSLELVENSDKVMLYVTLPKFPRYREEILSDGLLRKLKDEYGAPPEPPSPPEKPPPEEPPSDEPDPDHPKPDEPKDRPREERPPAAD